MQGVMYVYLRGLAVSNLCALLAAIPALIDISFGFKVRHVHRVTGCSGKVFRPREVGRMCCSSRKTTPSSISRFFSRKLGASS